MLITICLNMLLAALVLWLAYGLWQWRYGLMQLTAWLQSASLSASLSATEQIGYAATLKRTQMLQTRLTLIRLKRLIVQVRQVSGLIKILRMVLIYQAGQQRLLRRKKHKNAVE